ncbi:MAG TPA: hypothetical protein VJB14_08765 [Planctomycetota bacterium]|nr:hypothetical protein [Planctomycetota bacterium]
MRNNGKRGAHDGIRISKIDRDSMEYDFAREAGVRVKAFITRRPILSTCLGLAAGFMCGMLFRSRE